MNRRTYDQSILNQTQSYVDFYNVIYGDRIPTKAGLCRALGVSKTVIYRWVELHEAFAVMIDQLMLEKERQLINFGLIGMFNSNLTKLALVEHGYSDKSVVDHNINPKDLKELSDEDLNYVIEHGRLPVTS